MLKALKVSRTWSKVRKVQTTSIHCPIHLLGHKLKAPLDGAFIICRFLANFIGQSCPAVLSRQTWATNPSKTKHACATAWCRTEVCNAQHVYNLAWFPFSNWNRIMSGFGERLSLQTHWASSTLLLLSILKSTLAWVRLMFPLLLAVWISRIRKCWISEAKSVESNTQSYFAHASPSRCMAQHAHRTLVAAKMGCACFQQNVQWSWQLFKPYGTLVPQEQHDPVHQAWKKVLPVRRRGHDTRMLGDVCVGVVANGCCGTLSMLSHIQAALAVSQDWLVAGR